MRSLNPLQFHPELTQKTVDALKSSLLRDAPRLFDREAEASRRGRRPFRVRCGAMLTLKRKVDFRAAELFRVPLEVRPGRFEPIGDGARIAQPAVPT